MENQTNNTKKIALAVGGYIAFALIAYTVMSGLSMGFDAPVREFILSLRQQTMVNTPDVHCFETLLQFFADAFLHRILASILGSKVN